MAYRYGDRNQGMLFPSSIEDFVADDSPVRAYDVMVDAMDLATMDFELAPHKVGCPQYDPVCMLKLLVYGYSYGMRSSRKLERECHNNVTFIWLMGGMKPDHKTIAEFRRKNKKALKQVIRQCAQVCMKLGLIAGNTFFVDGTTLRGNASLKNSWNEKRCQKALQKIEAKIETILSECEAVDQQEADQGSLVHLQEELQDCKMLKGKVQAILQTIQGEGLKSYNTTDKDAVKLCGPQGAAAGYNVQSVVDEKHGLIVHCKAVSVSEDTNQFADQIEQAQDTLGKKCDTACSDAGYCNFDELKRVAKQEIDVIVPSRQQARHSEERKFAKSSFSYDRERDLYICPAGEVLCYHTTGKDGRREYCARGTVCRACKHYGVCTTAKKSGRKICRYEDEKFREQISQRYLEPDAQDVYRLRKQKVELPFGHFKKNMNISSFLLRGQEGTCAEASLFASCFNITRMITLLGIPMLLEKLAI